MEEKNYFQGLELLFKLVQGSFLSREDCLIAAVHIVMINKGNKCIGIGDDWPDKESTSASELLPENWNSNQDVYTLRYISNSSGIRYLMKVVKAGNLFLLNVFNVNEEKAAGMSVVTDNYVCDTFNDFDSTYKNLDDLSKSFHQEIITKVFPTASQSDKPGTSKEKRSTQSTQSDVRGPFSIDGNTIPSSYREPRAAFPSVGRGDLDPLGGGYGGGMLFDPRSMMPPSHPPFGIGGPGGLPRGAVPPGARFDPFGPPGGGRGRSYLPDPDHLPPPGFDDSFM